MYIKRFLEKDIKEDIKYFPVIAILGPRQSGKTTLARHLFVKHNYVTLENIDNRNAAQKDPRTFLDLYSNKYGVIIDEFQHVPDLLSYIQTIVDEVQQRGYFILTGSQNFLMNQAISYKGSSSKRVVFCFCDKNNKQENYFDNDTVNL